jgi:hypothetical protein
VANSAVANSAVANSAVANSAVAKPKRRIVSSIEDGPTDYDREKYHSHLIEQYKLYVEMADRPSARRVLVNNSFITLTGAGAIAFAAASTSFGGGSAVSSRLRAVEARPREGLRRHCRDIQEPRPS